MPSPLASMEVDQDTMDFLKLIYVQFNQDLSTHFMLKSADGACVEVEVHENLAYRFCKKGSPEAFCVVALLEFETSNLNPENHTQLLIVERQKRGLPHVTPCNVTVIMETVLHFRDVEKILNEKA